MIAANVYRSELKRFPTETLPLEGGRGQYEFDFDYAPALEMADKMTFFRLIDW